MEILPIILFFLGIVFLFLGWRWQGSVKDQDQNILKGLALLRREIIKVQDQVILLEGEVQKNKLDRLNGQNESQGEEMKEYLGPQAQEVQETQVDLFNRIEPKAVSLNELENPNQQDYRKSKESVCKDEPSGPVPLKYQKVLELDALGQSVQEIARNLMLSQDAVQMVLKTHSKLKE